MIAIAAIGVAIGGVVSETHPLTVVATGVVACFALGATMLAVRRPDERMAQWVALVALAMAGSIHGSGPALAATLAVGGIVLVSAPGGRLTSRWDRLAAAVITATGLAAAVLEWTRRPGVAATPIAVEATVVALIGLAGYLARCRLASPVDRARLQWLGWALVVAGTIGLAVLGLDAILGLPHQPATVALGATVLVPLALVAGTYDAAINLVHRLLVRTIVVAGLVTLVIGVYLVVVIGLGHVPTSRDRSVLALSMVAAGLAALLTIPARRRLEEVANQRVYGATRAPDEPLRTFAGRMSRAVPLDELLLQLAESLHKSLRLQQAEVWTGTDGVLDRVASVPDRGDARITLADEELAVVARAHVSGSAWAQVWIPELVRGRAPSILRTVSVSHLGDLLGLIVVERRADGLAFTEEDDRVLAELARPLGLALHNVRLDSALQASLDELRLRNEELRASRARIVAASDDSRRQIERNLHDGAQQHLVAMAVKIGLARQLLDSDPSVASAMLEELRTDVQDTLTELRELAHGIYPPLLRDRGLPEALQTAANRATLPTQVEADGIGRYPEGVETAVYFCCLEAMQNAGKHAGPEARLTVRVTVETPADDTGLTPVLCFTVRDDGAGFDVGGGAVAGHGFVNMRDRLGAIGGELTDRVGRRRGHRRVGPHPPRRRLTGSSRSGARTRCGGPRRG